MAEQMKHGLEDAYGVDVHLKDHKIEMDDRLFAGPTNFVVHNEGKRAHNFQVEGQGLDRKFDSELKPGETRVMQVKLEPGTYEVECPGDLHKQDGMKMELEVTGPRKSV